jgi:predicted ABC-type ATPase
VPSLYIITGSNGAGKSTIGPEYLPEYIRDNYIVFDGDLLFVNKQRELFPHITRSPKEAKKLAFEYVVDTFEQLTANALNRNDTFVYEGHLQIMPHGIPLSDSNKPVIPFIYCFLV